MDILDLFAVWDSDPEGPPDFDYMVQLVLRIYWSYSPIGVPAHVRLQVHHYRLKMNSMMYAYQKLNGMITKTQ